MGQPSLRRTLNLTDAVVIGLGSMVGVTGLNLVGAQRRVGVLRALVVVVLAALVCVWLPGGSRRSWWVRSSWRWC